MKRLFGLLLILLSIACSDRIAISQEEYNRLKGLPAPRTFTVEDGYTYNIKTADDGHDYYRISFYNRGYLHYPGCLKCNKDSITIK